MHKVHQHSKVLFKSIKGAFERRDRDAMLRKTHSGMRISRFTFGNSNKMLGPVRSGPATIPLENQRQENDVAQGNCIDSFGNHKNGIKGSALRSCRSKAP